MTKKKNHNSSTLVLLFLWGRILKLFSILNSHPNQMFNEYTHKLHWALDQTGVCVEKRPRVLQNSMNLFTCSGAHGVHGGHGYPLVPVWVVALTGVQAVGTIKTSYSVQQPVDDSHTNTYTLCQHGGYQLPLIPLWIVPAEERQHGFRVSFSCRGPAVVWSALMTSDLQKYLIQQVLFLSHINFSG